MPGTTGNQAVVIEFLATPSTYGGMAVDRIDTHSAVVFLVGRRAYKLKRAVLFDYLDFSTPDRRHLMCEAEVRLNRRTAPSLYLDVLAVTRACDGALSLGGEGTPIDWVVVMDRFDQEALFDRLAEAGQLALSLMSPLATAIAKFHSSAEVRIDHGGKPGMSWVIEGNAAGFAEYGAACLEPSVCLRVNKASLTELSRRSDLLESRRSQGHVRQCHGDLHLRNIVLLDGRPTPFDGVEFNEDIACTDVLYDLAFLLMDLWRRRLPRHANAVWNRYLIETGDLGGLPLLPLFLSCRAAVRAKTSATAAGFQEDSRRRGELQEAARTYLAMAEALLVQPSPTLIAIGGLSGSGKSTLALGLAPSVGSVPGAVVHRSDEIRKQLCGAPLLERLGPEGYSPAVTDRVYATLAERAARTLQGGFSTIVDAVYAQASERLAIERVAADLSVRFVGLWLDAPESTLVARAEARQLDPSDANAAVIRNQLHQKTGSVEWHHIDASSEANRVLEVAIAASR